MPGAYDPLLAGIVCILDQKHTIIGAGFVLSISAQGGKIATCTHVIEKYYGRIHDSSDSTARPTIYFQFEVDDRQTLLEAVVERCSPSDTYDISILSCTTKKFPSKVRSLPLGQVISIKGHQVSTFGFPI
ncbi:MAG TPA: hypothetical protein VFN23_04720 [Ktedonobacteraceae bacterium]|nr:hypothetical protein [Ktedonobacteraceae bacterium]